MRLIDGDELLTAFPVDDEPTLTKACVRMTIKHMPTIEQPRWIPVTERLPEYGTEVVTINKDDEYEINHVIDEEDGEWFWDGAVAWMPLPEAYKRGEEQ